MNQKQALAVRKQITTGLDRAMTRVLGRLVGRTISKTLIGSARRQTLPLVRAARRSLAASASRQYRELVVENPMPAPALSRFSEGSWEASFLKVLDVGKELTEDHVRQVIRKGDFWARDAERGTLIGLAEKDPRISRWARIDPESPTCGFCTVLISRGAVYESKESAGVAETARFHTGCTCVAILVLEGQEKSFEGYDSQQAALAEYQRAVKHARSGDLSKIVAAMQTLRDEPATEGKTP